MCGGNLDVQEGMTVCECEYCGSTQTLPSLDDEKKINLFTRANRLRSACEFDKAFGVYESVVAEFPEEAEAYWGLILCKYGIEYVDDPKTGKKVPTCHRSSFDNVLEDENFEFVMEYSDPASRAIYREEAKVIEALRVGIIEVSSKEDPYDIFICYKETDLMGERTFDSVIAQDVYDALTEKGYRVFFSRITLEDKLGQEYEPYIFAALNSAKIMLAFGTDYEHYNAVWVKNEWSRFLSLIEKGEKKTLIPCYKNIDAYDMPKEFARLQAQDMGKVGAIQDLVRGVGKIIGATATQPQNDAFNRGSAEGAALVQRGNMALEDGDFAEAEGHFERALDANPSDAFAYLGLFLAKQRLKSLSDLADKGWELDEHREFRRAEQFADESLAVEIKKVKDANLTKIKRVEFVSVLKNYNKTMLYDLKKTAFVHIMESSMSGEKEARNIYMDLLNRGLISKTEYTNFLERIFIVKGIATILGDYEMHSNSIYTMPQLNKYKRSDVLEVLKELLQYNLIEKHPRGYCLAATEEEKALFREKKKKLEAELEEKRKKLEAELEEKKRLEQEKLEAKLEEKKRMQREEIERKIWEDNERKQRDAERKKEEKKVALSEEKMALQKELANLKGLFSGRRRKAIEARLVEIEDEFKQL